MNPDDIIGEIHRVREKLAAECGFDPKRIGERAAQGVRYVSPPQSAVVREEPPKP